MILSSWLCRAVDSEATRIDKIRFSTIYHTSRAKLDAADHDVEAFPTLCRTFRFGRVADRAHKPITFAALPSDVAL